MPLPLSPRPSVVGAHPVRDRPSRRSPFLVVPTSAGWNAKRGERPQGRAKRVSQFRQSSVVVSRYCDLARLRRASARLPTSGLLLFVWPKRSNQEKGHPNAAPLRGRRREAGWIDRRPALTIPWPASMPATLRAIPPPACSRHRGGKVTSQSDERSLLPVGAHPVRDRRGH